MSVVDLVEQSYLRSDIPPFRVGDTVKVPSRSKKGKRNGFRFMKASSSREKAAAYGKPSRCAALPTMSVWSGHFPCIPAFGQDRNRQKREGSPGEAILSAAENRESRQNQGIALISCLHCPFGTESKEEHTEMKGTSQRRRALVCHTGAYSGMSKPGINIRKHLVLKINNSQLFALVLQNACYKIILVAFYPFA